MKPLTIDELNEAVQSGRPVVFGSCYCDTFPGKYIVHWIDVRSSGCYGIHLNGDPHTAAFVTGNGFGIGSGMPVFFWADPNQTSDGRCHCVAPKPILLLVRTVCNSCGKDIR